MICTVDWKEKVKGSLEKDRVCRVTCKLQIAKIQVVALNLKYTMAYLKGYSIWVHRFENMCVVGV